VPVVDLSSPKGAAAPQRIVSAIIQRGDVTWFVTLKGPIDPITRERGHFDEFVRSLHFADGDTSANSAQPPPPTSAPAPVPSAPPAGNALGYQAPADWKPAEGKNDMRVLGFSAGPALVTVDRLPAGGMGTLLATVNMWRGEVGLKSLADEQAIKPDGVVTIDGRVAMLFDLTGPQDGASAANNRLIIATTRVGSEDWFVKILGPTDAVAAQKPAFLAFMQSIRFAGSSAAGGGGGGN
jgi:hypothetical protein